MLGRIRAWIYRHNKERCNTCGRILTMTEKHYYITRCEKCERRLLERIEKEDKLCISLRLLLQKVKSWQMDKEDLKAFVRAGEKWLLIGILWKILELLIFYGEIQPRIVDDFIGSFLFYYMWKSEYLLGE